MQTIEQLKESLDKVYDDYQVKFDELREGDLSKKLGFYSKSLGIAIASLVVVSLIAVIITLLNNTKIHLPGVCFILLFYATYTIVLILLDKKETKILVEIDSLWNKYYEDRKGKQDYLIFQYYLETIAANGESAILNPSGCLSTEEHLKAFRNSLNLS